jgi:hypothetical protein
VDLPAAGGATAVVFSREAGNVNKELVITSGTDVFLSDMGTGNLVQLGPGITSRAMGTDVRKLVLEENGQFGFVFHDTGEIGAVQVQRFAGFDPDTPLAATERLAAFPSVASVMGRGADIAVRKLAAEPVSGNPRFAIYASWSCESCVPDPPTLPPCGNLSAQLDPGQPTLMAQDSHLPAIAPAGRSGGAFQALGGLFATSLSLNLLLQECGIYSNCQFYALPGGGGSGSTVFRNVWLSVRVLQANLVPGSDFLQASNPWIPECNPDYLISQTGVSVGSPLWEHIGMAFSTDSDPDRLYVVSPDSDQLFIFNTITGELEPEGIINVGEHPFDVAAVDLNIPSVGDRERVYVANHGHDNVANDDTLTIIDPSGANPPKTISLNSTFGDPGELSIERITGSAFSRFFFLVSPDKQRVYVLNGLLNGDSPIGQYSFPVGSEPGKVAVPVTAP